MKYLILLDKKFPFKSGEAFLENEIDEISPYFDKILIFPSDPKIGSTMTRKIKSKNVEATLFESNEYSIRKYGSLFSSIFSKPIAQADKKLSIKEKITEKYFSRLVIEQSKKIISIIEKNKFNVNDEIYVYSYWLYITAGVCVELKKYFEARGMKCSAISRAHRFDIYEENRFLPARKYLLENLDSIYACSDDGTEYLKNKYPNYSNKIKTSYLGTYDHGLGKKSEDDIFRIVSCSRVSDIKRVELIVDILSNCRVDKKIRWTHIGDGALIDKVKRYAAEKLVNNIEFDFLGYMPNTCVYEYYQKTPVDLFINVSSSEGLPVSIMEAVSFGIPVIATNVGGTGEIVRNNISGFLIDKNFNIKKAVQIVEDIISMDCTEYENLRISTRKLWTEKFEAKRNYELFSKMLLKQEK